MHKTGSSLVTHFLQTEALVIRAGSSNDYPRFSSSWSECQGVNSTIWVSLEKSWFSEAHSVPSAWCARQSRVSSEPAATGQLTVPLGKRWVSASVPLTGLLTNPHLAQSRHSQEDLQRKQFKPVAYFVLISKINKIKWIIYLEITYLPPTLACRQRYSRLPLDITACRIDQRSNNNYQYNYTCNKIKK